MTRFASACAKGHPALIRCIAAGDGGIASDLDVPGDASVAKL